MDHKPSALCATSEPTSDGHAAKTDNPTATRVSGAAAVAPESDGPTDAASAAAEPKKEYKGTRDEDFYDHDKMASLGEELKRDLFFETRLEVRVHGFFASRPSMPRRLRRGRSGRRRVTSCWRAASLRRLSIATGERCITCAPAKCPGLVSTPVAVALADNNRSQVHFDEMQFNYELMEPHRKQVRLPRNLPSVERASSCVERKSCALYPLAVWQVTAVKLPIHLNIALALIKAGEYREAVEHCTKVHLAAFRRALQSSASHSQALSLTRTVTAAGAGVRKRQR